MTTKRPTTPKPDSGARLSPQVEASPGVTHEDWTPEEMAAAQPLPLPTTPATSSQSSVATAAGCTSPAGQPEEP
jgi:hypothetical protein